MKIKCSFSIADPYLFEGASRHHVHHFNLLFANNKVQFFFLRSKSGVIHGDVFLPTLLLFYRCMFVNKSQKHIFPLFVSIQRPHEFSSSLSALHQARNCFGWSSSFVHKTNSSSLKFFICTFQTHKWFIKKMQKRKLMFYECLEIRF